MRGPLAPERGGQVIGGVGGAVGGGKYANGAVEKPLLLVPLEREILLAAVLRPAAGPGIERIGRRDQAVRVVRIAREVSQRLDQHGLAIVVRHGRILAARDGLGTDGLVAGRRRRARQEEPRKLRAASGRRVAHQRRPHLPDRATGQYVALGRQQRGGRPGFGHALEGKDAVDGQPDAALVERRGHLAAELEIGLRGREAHPRRIEEDEARILPQLLDEGRLAGRRHTAPGQHGHDVRCASQGLRKRQLLRQPLSFDDDFGQLRHAQSLVGTRLPQPRQARGVVLHPRQAEVSGGVCRGPRRVCLHARKEVATGLRQPGEARSLGRRGGPACMRRHTRRDAAGQGRKQQHAPRAVRGRFRKHSRRRPVARVDHLRIDRDPAVRGEPHLPSDQIAHVRKAAGFYQLRREQLVAPDPAFT